MPILDARTEEFISHSVAQTERLGMRLGRLLSANDWICLSGDLGAGKTALARGIGRGWGTVARVTSPTFTLINEYPRASDGCILYHVDGYRLMEGSDIDSLALDDLLHEGGVYMVEWPERIMDLVPTDYLWVTLSYHNATRRRLQFRAQGKRPEALLKEFKQSAFGV